MTWISALRIVFAMYGCMRFDNMFTNGVHVFDVR